MFAVFSLYFNIFDSPTLYAFWLPRLSRRSKAVSAKLFLLLVFNTYFHSSSTLLHSRYCTYQSSLKNIFFLIPSGSLYKL